VGRVFYERGKSRMALPDAGLYSRIRRLLPELIKFGVVGGIGSVIDLGGAAVLHGKYHVGPLESKAISTAVPGLPVLDVQGPGEPVAAA
jgi:hypothetical protein